MSSALLTARGRPHGYILKRLLFQGRRINPFEKLLKAAEQLRSAVPLQEDRTLPQAYVCVDLAVVLRLLGDKETSVFYARMAIEAAKGFVVRMEAEKLRPPGFSPTRHRASQVFFNLTTDHYGSDWRKDWKDVSIDDSMNSWYRMVYDELGPIVTAVTALCGEKDSIVSEAKSTIPCLRCQSGQIRNVGIWHEGMDPWSEALWKDILKQFRKQR